MFDMYKKLSFLKRFFISALVLVTAFVAASCSSQKSVTNNDGQTPDSDMISEGVAEDADIPVTPREFRAVWVATVANIDWPSERGLPVEQQKQELIDIMDRAAAMNMNAVIFQVRPAADAMYASRYEPWSAFLTGQMGEVPVPYYDPLELAVEEAHKRGLELHAWFNPYRAHHPSDSSEVAPNHVSRKQPELVLQFGDYQWLDPGLEEVRNLSRNVILDVVKRYDIDGVHLDDYFYPYPSYGRGAEFPDSLSWQQALANDSTWQRNDWRRNNVDRFIKQVYKDIKEEKPHVKFGISPFGTWRPGYPEGTGGFDAYSQLYADARLWLREGWVDYFTPQIYNRIDRVIRPFPVILQWWSEQNTHNRHLWPGLYTSKGSWNWSPDEITGQVYTARGFPGITGTIHFSMRSLMEWNSLVGDITGGPYASPALVPASPWLGSASPSRPSATLNAYADKMLIEIEPPEENKIRWWVVQSKTAGKWELDIIPGSQHKIVFSGTEATIWPDKVTIAGVDRLGNEGPATVLVNSSGDQYENEEAGVPKPKIVKRNEWGSSPGGYRANAVRRNLAEGDALKFRDLTVVLNKMIGAVDSTGRDSSKASEGDHKIQDKEMAVLPDTAHISLYRYGIAEELKVPEGKAFNWQGYHVGLLAVNSEKGVLGSGLTEIEIGTVASLPVARAAAIETGGASQRLRVPHKIKKITLHHSGSSKPLTSEEDPVERLSNLYKWSRESRKWWDVPYHYLVGLDGTIYEGRDPRYAGETNTTYDTRGHLLISVMGNYDQQKPTQEQINAISELMAWSSAKYDISPQNINGHFELADTGCPGLHLREVFEDGIFHQAVEGQLRELTAGN